MEHDTTVYKVLFDHDGDEADLWTASGDGKVKCLSRAKGYAAEDTIEHGDHVRAVALTAHWVVTAGRDEDIRVWDRASGKLYATLEGHYDEVLDLIVDLPRSKNCDSILVVVDRLSKMTRLIPTTKTVTSEGLARLYRDNIWKDFGLPARIISDRGTTFLSSFARALNKLLGCRLVTS